MIFVAIGALRVKFKVAQQVCHTFLLPPMYWSMFTDGWTMMDGGYHRIKKPHLEPMAQVSEKPGYNAIVSFAFFCD